MLFFIYTNQLGSRMDTIYKFFTLGLKNQLYGNKKNQILNFPLNHIGDLLDRQ